MKYFNWLCIFILTVYSCSSTEKIDDEKQFSKACLEIIKNTKIKAPGNVSYHGLFSSLKYDVEQKPTGIIIRIVRHLKDCSALVLEYQGNTQPSMWSYTSKFECDLSNLTLVANTGFRNPYKNELPVVHDFTFKGHVLVNGDLQGALIYDPQVSGAQKPVQKILLSKMPPDEFDMASFDWETIELMRLKSRCQ